MKYLQIVNSLWKNKNKSFFYGKAIKTFFEKLTREKIY